jgi:hypothetical protein
LLSRLTLSYLLLKSNLFSLLPNSNLTLLHITLHSLNPFLRPRPRPRLIYKAYLNLTYMVKVRVRVRVNRYPSKAVFSLKGRWYKSKGTVLLLNLKALYKGLTLTLTLTGYLSQDRA